MQNRPQYLLSLKKKSRNFFFTIKLQFNESHNAVGHLPETESRLTECCVSSIGFTFFECNPKIIEFFKFYLQTSYIFLKLRNLEIRYRGVPRTLVAHRGEGADWMRKRGRTPPKRTNLLIKESVMKNFTLKGPPVVNFWNFT